MRSSEGSALLRRKGFAVKKKDRLDPVEAEGKRPPGVDLVVEEDGISLPSTASKKNSRAIPDAMKFAPTSPKKERKGVGLYR